MINAIRQGFNCVRTASVLASYGSFGVHQALPEERRVPLPAIAATRVS